MKAIYALAAAILLLLVAACGGSSKPKVVATTSAPITTTSAAAATSAATSSSPTPTHATVNLATQIMTISDLPTGWAIDNSKKDASGPDCFTHAQDLSDTAQQHIAANFAKGDLPLFGEGLGYFKDPAGASTEYGVGVAALNACKQVTIKSDGETASGTVGAMSFPTLGEGSSAYDISLTLQGIDLTLYLVLFHKGPELGVLEYGDLGTADITDFQQLATTALAKVTG